MRNGDEKIIGIKANLYDIVSKNETILKNIEQNLVSETDPKKVEFLRELWERYNNDLKNSITYSNLFFECTRAMNIYSNDYHRFMASTHKSIQPQNVASNFVNNEEVMDETVQQEVVSAPLEKTNDEVSQQEVVSAPLEETNDEVSQQEVVPAPLEETNDEVSHQEVVPAPLEKTNDEVSQQEVVPAPLEETNDVVPQQEVVPVPLEEANDVVPQQEVVPAPLEETNDVVPQQEAVPAPLEETNDVVPQQEVVLAPLEEVNDSVVQQEAASENVQSVASTQLIPLDNATVSEKKAETNVIDFIKESANPDKAILINGSQAFKLRGSLASQKSIFLGKDDNLENVSEDELEKMVNEVTKLFNEGKTKEAEALSDKISVLSKKMSNNSVVAA